MLLIVIVALIATGAFYRQAKRAGAHPGKAASVPFVAAGIVFIAEYLASWVIATVANAADASAFTVNAIAFMLNVFLVLAYLAVIRRTWNGLVTASKLSGIEKADA